METIRKTLFTGWNFMRWLRFGLGGFLAIQAVQTQDGILGFLATFLLFQSITNTGCCASSACSVPITKNKNETIEDIEFEEIKSK